ncbi:hypothetical protein BD289DRAFT_363871 [Coniella lustricola]|uniref:DUF1772-domain-containing protein n=1 Tax=Coniella lustricola TaxID=2025994 RepID=A0A2T3AEK2_9PEZI|nr:hypothetical protein BD289DRAFT_363871 [Coniella lustricola]
MSGLPSATIIAATVGILGSAWNSGGQAMLSILAVPGLLSTTSPVHPQSIAQQWAGIYNRGKVLGPQTAVLSLLGYTYLAYQNKSQGRPWHVFVGAAVISIAIVPFTIVVMNPTNQALLQAAEGANNLGSEAVSQLLLKWKDLNLMRSFFPLAGAALGFYGLVAKMRWTVGGL